MDTLELRPIKTEVEAMIINSIGRGELKFGQRIVEHKLAKGLGISRSPVREAIQELVQQGILVSFPRKGTYVAEVTPAAVREFSAIRSYLEGLAARWAVANIDQHDLQQLTDLNKRMMEAATEVNINRFVDFDIAFHDLIVNKSQSDRLINLLSSLKLHVRLFMLFTKSTLPAKVLKMDVQAHGLIIDTLKTGDADLAEVSLRNHIMKVGIELQRAWESKESDTASVDQTQAN